MKTALIIGATGMVGSELVNQLLQDNVYTQLISFVRKKSGINHPKLIEHIVNFDNHKEWSALVKGDVLFSVLGTTLANAKSKENQYKVDYTYQYQTAKTARQNDVSAYVLVSSAGANSKAKSFYLNMKGKLDEAVLKIPFKTIHILRPSQLDGNRTEKRNTEKIALKLMYAINNTGLLKKYRPIQAADVARAMIIVANKPDSGIYSLDEIFKLIK